MANHLIDSERISKAVSYLESQGVISSKIIFVGGTVFEYLGLRKASDIDMILTSEGYKKIASKKATDIRGPFEAINISEEIQVLKNPYRYIGLEDDEIFNQKLFTELDIGNNQVIFIALPELEFGKKIFRNREKDLNDILLLQNYSFGCTDWRWDLIPTHPTQKIIYSTKKISINKNLILRSFKHPIKLFKFIVMKLSSKFKCMNRKSKLRDLHIKSVDIGTVLQWQFKSKKFIRYDTFLRKITFKNYLVEINKHNSRDEIIKKVFSDYIKMQYLRVSKSNLSYLRFEELINSVSIKGFHPDRHPITLDKYGRLVDGSHRLSIALEKGINHVPVFFSKTKKGPVDFGRDWFLKNRFREDLLDSLDREINNSMINTGAYFVVIIWPPAQQFVDEIKSLINERYEIITQSLSQKIFSFPEFINEIYLGDDIEKWKIDKKIYHMKNSKSVISTLVVRIDKPNYRVKKRTSSYMSDKVAELKLQIRNKYRNKIENYVHDIIIHIGDNPSMNRGMIQVLNDFGIELNL